MKCLCGNKATQGLKCSPCSTAEMLDKRRMGRLFRNEVVRKSRESKDGVKVRRRKKFRLSQSDKIHIKRGGKR